MPTTDDPVTYCDRSANAKPPFCPGVGSVLL